MVAFISNGLRAVRQVARSVLRRAMNFGLRYSCPMCGAHLRAFRPRGERHAVLTENAVIGGGRRANVKCPVCSSSDRERLVYLYLKNGPQLPAPGTKLLHIAPEANLQVWLRAKLGTGYTTADLGAEGVDYHFDLTSIPFDDGTFDAIICNHVLEHVPDDAKAMAEVRRVLKPGGLSILQTPISATLPTTYEDFTITAPKERERAFGQHDHVRIYNHADYVRRLQNAGFTVETFRWPTDDAAYGGEGNRFGLIDDEVIYIARPA